MNIALRLKMQADFESLCIEPVVCSLDLEVGKHLSLPQFSRKLSQFLGVFYCFQKVNTNGYWLICKGMGFCCRGMEKEKEAKSQRGHNINRATEDFGLQWGNRKRLRCVKVKDQSLADKSDCLGKKKITSRVDRRVVGTADKGLGSPQLQRLHK